MKIGTVWMAIATKNCTPFSPGIWNCEGNWVSIPGVIYLVRWTYGDIWTLTDISSHQFQLTISIQHLHALWITMCEVSGQYKGHCDINGHISHCQACLATLRGYLEFLCSFIQSMSNRFVFSLSKVADLTSWQPSVPGHCIRSSLWSL